MDKEKSKEPEKEEDLFISKCLRGKGWFWLDAGFTVNVLGGIYFRIYGLRGDGVYIYCQEQVLEQEDGAVRSHNVLLSSNAAIEKAIKKFETFRNCDCTIEKACPKHGGK